MTEVFKVLRITGNKREYLDDIVVREIPFTITLGDNELVTMLCCPWDLEDLVRGFLFTSGLIKNGSDIKKIIIDRQRWAAYVDVAHPAIEGMVFKRLYTSGCGRGTLFYNAYDLINRGKVVSDLKISAAQISKLMAHFQENSEMYKKTGGVHSAAIADDKGILIFKEDIGRHNAIDKVIGHGLKENISFENKIMLSSGRISSEVLLKTQKCKIPIVISRSAPTNQAIKHAQDMEITLVGFARGNRMNIYSVERRVQ